MDNSKAAVTNNVLEILKQNPVLIMFTILLIVALIVVIIWLVLKNAKSLKVGDFQIDLTKTESVKGETGKNATDIAEVKRRIEENTRHIISRQFALVSPFLQSLRPIFNRLMYSIMDDAIKSDLGVEPEKREVIGREDASELGKGSYYLVEKVKTYKFTYSTRVFTELVESSVDSLLSDLEIEIYKMLVSNNIGKNREEVQAYVKSRTENIIGIIRNNLCNSYNKLSNKNLFDTHKYWAETGITYPEDWISDKLYQLLKSCMCIRYGDFDE